MKGQTQPFRGPVKKDYVRELGKQRFHGERKVEVPGVVQSSGSLKINSTIWIITREEQIQKGNISIKTVEPCGRSMGKKSTQLMKKIPTLQSNVLVKLDTFWYGEFGRLYSKITWLQSPLEAWGRDHVPGEPTKGRLVGDLERRGLIDCSSFMARWDFT